MTPTLLALALALGTPARAAADAQAAWEAGSAAERRGDSAAAVRHLLDALEAGARHPAVYHALGNALYHEGRIGPAIAAWRRAEELAPRDGDVRANLDRARREARDRIEPPDRGAAPFFWQEWLSLREGAIAASALTGLALWSVFLPLARRRRVPPWAPALLGGTALLVAAGVAVDAAHGPGAVVVVPEVVARSATGPAGVDLFALHEGAEVAVRERAGSDVLVELPDGRRGWVPAAALLSADPSAPFDLPPAR